jgi:IMP dehydrogenase
MDVAEACRGEDVSIIADGGIKYSGDIAKAIAAGADCAMMGSMFAGTDEAPGEIFYSGDTKYKKYRGMGSIEAMQSGSAERYFQKEKSANLVSQGVVGTVPYKGGVEQIISQLYGGLVSAMGYTGNKTIASMQKNCQFCLVTQSGAKEGHVHSLLSYKETQNYIKK